MAYAFDRIQQALSGNESNVLAPGGEEEGGQQPAQQSLALTSSSEGDLSGGGSGGATPQQPAAQVQQTGGSSRVIQRNKDKAQGPVDVNRISSNIGDARSKIQSEANAYVSSASQPYQSDAGADARNYAEKGDANFLSRLNNKPGYVKDIELKTNTQDRDADLLQNDAGIRELYRRGADAEYNIGESALDAALLRQNQPFQLKRDAILNDYKQLKSEEAGIRQDSRAKAQKVQDDAYADWSSKAKIGLEGLLPEYERTVQSREADFDKRLQDAETARYGNIMSDASSALDEMRQNNPDLAPYLQDGIVGSPLNSFYSKSTFDADDTNWQDFINDEDSAKFERILGALGRGAEAKVPGRYVGGDPNALLTGGFDRGAYQNAARSAATIARDDAMQKQAVAEAAQKRIQDEIAAQEQAKVAEAERQSIADQATPIREDIEDRVASKPEADFRDYADTEGAMRDPIQHVDNRLSQIFSLGKKRRS